MFILLNFSVGGIHKIVDFSRFKKKNNEKTRTFYFRQIEGHFCSIKYAPIMVPTAGVFQFILKKIVLLTINFTLY